MQSFINQPIVSTSNLTTEKFHIEIVNCDKALWPNTAKLNVHFYVFIDKPSFLQVTSFANVH